MRKVRALALYVVLLFVACKLSNHSAIYTILNEHFLALVDTAAYNTGKLLQAPNDSVSFQKSNKNFIIAFDSVFMESHDYALKYFLPFLRESEFRTFSDLISEKNLVKDDHVFLEKIENVGRYRLKPANIDDFPYQEVVGTIAISRPYIENNRALFFFSVASGPKAGKLTAYFFTKSEGHWQNSGSLEIEKW